MSLQPHTNKHHMKNAFTLIELMVVLVVVSMVMSMIFVQSEDKTTNVRIAAMQLEATLSQARNLARQSGLAHAVVFHIENYGDGRVMRNFGPNDEREHGGHWYAIVGPNKGAQPKPGNNDELRAWTKTPSLPPLVLDDQNYNDTILNEFLNDIALSQVGPRYYLPHGVRFLALSDYDFGRNITDEKMWKTNLSDSNLLDEYPRPWFGVLKPASSLPNSIRPDAGDFVLYPWGGGDVEWENARNANNMSGLGTISGQTTNSRNHGILVNGERIDIGILFQADGTAVYINPFAARRSFQNLKNSNGSIYNDPDLLKDPFYWNARKGPRLNVNDENKKNSGLHNCERITGGIHITLARDVDEDESIYPIAGRVDVFNNEEDALESILPMYRVYVNNFTASTVIRSFGEPMAEVKMNQARVNPSDVGQTHPSTGVLLRPAYRHSYFSDSLIPSKRDAEWDDTPEGWRGWYPDY